MYRGESACNYVTVLKEIDILLKAFIFISIKIGKINESIGTSHMHKHLQSNKKKYIYNNSGIFNIIFP